MVSLYGKVVPCKVMSPLTHCPDDAQQLPFIGIVLTLDRVEFSAIIADRL